MSASNEFGPVLILIFAGLLLFIIFLVFKRRSEGIFGNRLVVFGAIVATAVVFMVVKGPLIDYFQSIFKDSPYDFSDLRSIVFKYGDGDSLVNQYNSATGDYQYVNKRGSLKKIRMYLTPTDMLYLHRRAAEDGFWDFPANELNTDTTDMNGIKPPRYLIEFNYVHKSKKVLFDTNYLGPQKLVEENQQLIRDIETVLTEAEDRQKK